MDLLFTPMEVAAVILAVLLSRLVAEDGESNWLEGAMLLMIYAILGVAFFFLAVGLRDLTQKRHAVLRNYPIAAHLRFIGGAAYKTGLVQAAEAQQRRSEAVPFVFLPESGAPNPICLADKPPVQLTCD